jgi:hypothetical protein
MKKTHRSVEFDVHRLDDGRWEWIAYPKLGEGVRFAGALEDDEEKATAAAIAAIDTQFGSSDTAGSEVDEKIYVDASQPASLLDGAALTSGPTLQEAVIAWHRLPRERQRTATIRTAANVFTAQEIDRLYYGPETVGTAATVPPGPVSVSAPPQWTG